MEGRPLSDGDVAGTAALADAVAESLDPPLEGLGGAALRAELGRAGAEGYVVGEGGHVSAVVIGRLVDEPPWRRSAWVGLAGWAAADPAALEDCYAAAAADWVADGRFEHVVVSPAAPDAWEPWFRLGFGCEQVHALRPVVAMPGGESSAVVRRAGPDDLALILPLVDLVQVQVAASPAFAPSAREWRADYPQGHADLLADPAVRYLVAIEEGVALGFAVFAPLEAGPGVPDSTIELKLAAVAPTARRRGAVRAMVAAGLTDAAAEGYSWCATDWRSASLGTARTWTALGFRATHLRLRRRLDDRIAWARPT